MGVSQPGARIPEAPSTSVGLWTEDGNSPLTVSEENSFTYTLDSEWTEVMVRITNWTTSAQNNTAVFLDDLNGEEQDWDARGFDLVLDTGITYFQIGELDAMGAPVGELYMTGKWQSTHSFGVRNMTVAFRDSGVRLAGRARSVTSPLTEFSIHIDADNPTMSATVEVFGRDPG